MSDASETPLLRHWGQHRRPPRRSPPRWIWLLLAVSAVGALVLALLLVGRWGRWSSPSGRLRFDSCTYGGYVDGWCTQLRVPEDPRKPDGRKISLRIAVLPATKRPAAGALFYLEGGPGGAATAAAIRVNASFAEVQRNRDLVMIDQRGTGGSRRLACSNRYVRRTSATAVTGYLRRCLARLEADPRLYTTSMAAADLEIARRALGYGKIDLFGGSYGATLAEAYVRWYPRSVRSVILDGGSLPQVRIYDVSARNAEQALDTRLARCAAAPACARAYPHPRRQLDELLARPPRRVALATGTVLLRPADIAWTVDLLSETAEEAASIPFAVNAAVHGDYTTLATTYVGRLGGSNLEALARLVPFWIILCSEPWASFDPAATARAGKGSYLADAAVARARLFRKACAVVPKGRAPTSAASRRVVRVPTLLLAGGADPLDPPANLRGWRRLFPRGRLIVVPGAGHGTLEYDCVQKLIARFVDRPTVTRLDASCVRDVPLPPFLSG
jgi:pimeloyl-ACP methyl ester carboxylesterase